MATTPESYLLGNDKAVFAPDTRALRHLIHFLQWRFSLLPAGSYRWDPSSEQIAGQEGSEIYIAACYPIDPANVGSRPALTASVMSLPFRGIGIDDLAYVDTRTGARVRLDLLQTFLRIHLLSRLPEEAKQLAWFVTDQIWSFRHAIVKEEPVILHIGQRPEIGEPTPPGALVAPSAQHEWCNVTVMFPTYLQHSTTIMPLNKRILGEVQISLLPQEGPGGAQSGEE